MKKILSFTILFLLTTLICLPALSADTTFSGVYRIRSYSEWNYEKRFNDIDKAQYDGWFEQRFRLKITHTRSEYLKAVVMLDLVEDTWGQGRAMRINNATSPPINPIFGVRAGELINWAYLEFTFPTIGTFKVGKFPVTWGHGLIMSLGEDYDGLDGIEWSKDWGSISTTVLYWKKDDRVSKGPKRPDYNWDSDFIGLHIGYSPAENHLIELFGGWEHWHYYDLGFVALAYTCNIADMIDLKFEAGVGFGGYRENPSIIVDDVFGYSIYFDVSYYTDLLRIGLAFLMMSGREDSLDENLSSIEIENFRWGNIIGNEGGLNSPYNRWYWYLSGPQMENITSVKLYFEITPLEKLTLNAAVIWARFSEDVGPSILLYPHPARYGSQSSGWVYKTPSKSKDLGWEIDLGFSYEIMDGLTYTFAGGVLFTGDAWDYDADGVVGAPYIRENWGEIWSVVNTLTYEF